MRFFHASAIALSFHLSSAHPASLSLIPSPDTAGVARPRVVDIQQFQTASARDTVKITATSEVEGEEEGDEADISGTLDTPLALEGGDIKQDVTFPAFAGRFEVEFQAKTGRTLTVSENKTPAAPPTGFNALEPSSFKVALAEGEDGLTLGQIDFIFNVTRAALSGVDLTKSRVGKLPTETSTLVVDDAVGEFEFEDGENEPLAPRKAGTALAEEEEEDEKAGQIGVTGFFGSPNRVDANVFANLLTSPPINQLAKFQLSITAAMKAALDPAQGLPGKLDPATQQFVMTGLGEFGFEADERRVVAHCR
ncbi:hypothetical protein F5B21DRAFT_527764 [Xylaria acuta]|nr:hypothetical protein F5B21DRAFT_527764 [Xylaria acuta]